MPTGNIKMWQQKTLQLPPFPRGFHLITQLVMEQLPEMGLYRIGIAHIFVQHTSASLCINENADPTVRADMETHFSISVPEDASYYKHTLEGLDDMPAHIKSVLIGSAISVPIRNGKLVLGTWQGIYLGEHRNNGGARSLVVTLQGEPR